MYNTFNYVILKYITLHNLNIPKIVIKIYFETFKTIRHESI